MWLAIKEDMFRVNFEIHLILQVITETFCTTYREHSTLNKGSTLQCSMYCDCTVYLIDSSKQFYKLNVACKFSTQNVQVGI